MKLHIISDIHLEFSDMAIPEVDADVTVIAGDLHTGIHGLSWIRKLNRPVIYVPGNHEYYGYNIDKIRNDFRQQKSAYVLDNQTITLDGITFFGATMWTDFEFFSDPVFCMIHALRHMNDFKFIKHQTSRLTPADTIEFHKESLVHLKSFINENAAKKVIVTHHLPSALSVQNRYKTDSMTSAFASNLDEIVERSGAKLWLHGHTHDSCDYIIGQTRVVCNPRGYPPFNSHFDSSFVVDV